MRRPALAWLALLAACPGPQRELERAVREYDEALVRAYATADPSRLPEVATAREATRVRVLIDVKTAARLVLESRLEALEVTRAAGSGESAQVETRERWRYRDRRLQPGEVPGPEIVSAMAMRYELAREGGRWKVASVSTLSSEILEPKGFRPGAGHGRAPAHGSGPQRAPSP
jgi:hypothetical protein